jgi:hypothetical protein
MPTQATDVSLEYPRTLPSERRSEPALDEAQKLKSQVLQTLRSKFPHGHPEFLPITLEEAELHSQKNHDYAKGGSALGNFDRVSTILGLYPGFPFASPIGVAIVYALKQLDAVLWGLAKGIQHKVEGLDGRLADISVYAKICRCILRDQRKGGE